MAQKNIPAISVVIPMYNAAKYVEECLDSILAQTFSDFEVIVVDDCSTDKSVEIVEGYAEKFGGKLKLVRSKVNSGGAGTPRNIGLRISRGDYILFMDSDDAIMPNALEILNEVSTKYQPEVMHCARYFRPPIETVTTDRKALQEVSMRNPVQAPEFMSENVVERLPQLLNLQLGSEPWRNLIKREFLMENDLKFSSLSIADDLLFLLFLVFSAKKFLLFPNTFYVWRFRRDSNSKEQLPVDKLIHKRAGDIFKAIELLDKFWSGLGEHANDLRSKYTAFEYFATYGGLNELIKVYAQIPAYKLDPLIRRELSQFEDTTALTAFIFGRMNSLNVRLLQQQNLIRPNQPQPQPQPQAQPQPQVQTQKPQGVQQKPIEFHIDTEDIFKQ